jgi:hypothetical protein
MKGNVTNFTVILFVKISVDTQNFSNDLLGLSMDNKIPTRPRTIKEITT